MVLQKSGWPMWDFRKGDQIVWLQKVWMSIPVTKGKKDNAEKVNSWNRYDVARGQKKRNG